MAVLLTSAPRTGLSALGGGGWTAAGSYDQINRYLRRTLGPEHGLLFAEPSERPGIVDWYTEAPHTQTPLRFVEARPGQRETVRGVLARLVEEIMASAESLGNSDRQSDRITGEMLWLALEIPGESSVWIVGEQPVLVFWGHREDVAARTPNPLLGLIARRVSAGAGADPSVSVPRPRDTTISLGSGLGAGPASPTDDVARAERLGWLVPGLWAVMALLLLSIGLQLLRGCALGLPASLTGWLINFCAVQGAAAGLDPRLAAERARQAILQAEIEGLQRDAALKRQYCELRPPPQDPKREPRAELKPEPKEEIRPKPRVDEGPVIPTDVNPAKPFDYAEGCWIAGENLTERNDKERKYPYSYKICVDGQGNGQAIQEFGDGRTCRGTAQASRGNDKSLNFDNGLTACPRGPFSGFVRNRVVCTRGPDGIADCRMIQEGLPDVSLKLKRGAPPAP